MNNSIVSVSTGSDSAGSQTLQGTLVISGTQTLDIPAGCTLTLAEGAALNNKGTIRNWGKIQGGSIRNDGTIYSRAEDITANITGDKIVTMEEITYLDASGETQGISVYTVLDANMTTWNSGWYVVLGSVSIPSRVTVTGDVHLILTDGCKLTASQGVNVDVNNNLLSMASPAALALWLPLAAGGVSQVSAAVGVTVVISPSTAAR